MSTTRLDRASFLVLAITLFLTPIFFIPSLSVPFQLGKSALILYGVVIAFVLWCLARLKDGVYTVPKSFIYLSGGILIVVYALAAIFSENHGVSLWGSGFELGTLSFFLPSIVLFMLVPLVTTSQKEIFYSYTALIVSALVVGLFHLTRFAFGPDTLSFGILTSVVSNFFGKWNDLAIFFGLGAVLSFITLERGQVTKFMKVMVYALLVVSLIMLVVVNFSPVWITLALASLTYLIYEMSFGRKTGYIGARMPYHTLFVLVISVIFIFAGGKIGGAISNSLGISQVEVRPSWTATWEVSKNALAENPLFGIGPNRFSSEWLAHKPAGINNTLFWNYDFNYGIGFVPSFLVTTGILGFLAILYFMGLLLVKSARALFNQGASTFSHYLVLSSLFGSVYLWIFSIVYVPSASMWIITMIMSGLFLASLREAGVVTVNRYSVIDRPAASFISVLITILLLIAAIAFAYFLTVRLAANVYFQKGIITANQSGDLDKSAVSIANAIALSPADVYYQSLSELYLAKINGLLNDQKMTQSEAQTKFQEYLAKAIQSGQEAVKIDPTNYRNHMALGRVLESVVPLNVPGSYENAKKAYESALAVNPESPEIYLVLARLEVAHKDNSAAKEYITKSLEKKGDYADAIFLLSQIQIAENDVPNAIKSVEAVATLSPSDPGIFFQLGLLYYSNKDYQNAVLALERAVTLNPQYANAKYFLGLAYYQVGKKAESLKQFKELEMTNPDNSEVKTIVANLEAGKSPVSNPPPEKRATAPVKESTTREEI